MDPFEWNKIAGAVLATVLVVIVINNLGHSLFHEEPLEKNVYIVEGVEEEGASTEVAATEEEKVTPLPVLLADASADKGARVFKKCAACHSVDPADGNKTGPNLHGVVGADIGHRDDFNYSDAFKSHGGAWTFEVLFHYLENPKEYIPGNKMSFVGLRKPGDRADVIAYLNQQSDNPVALPAVEAPAEEMPADAAVEEPAAEPDDAAEAAPEAAAAEEVIEEAAPAE